MQWLGRVTAPGAALLLSGGFFGVAFVPALAAPIWAGAACLMVKNATKPASPTKADSKVVQLVLPRFARPEQHFQTRTTTKKEEGL